MVLASARRWFFGGVCNDRLEIRCPAQGKEQCDAVKEKSQKVSHANYCVGIRKVILVYLADDAGRLF